MAGEQDHAKARELLYVLGNFCADKNATPAQRRDFANKLDGEVLKAAKAKVLQHIAHINSMAEALRAKLTAYDTDAVLLQSEIERLPTAKF